MKFPLVRKIVTSKYLDFFAICLILAISILKGFQYTVYFKGEALFLQNIKQVLSHIDKGAYPLGFMSIIGAMFSMLSTRFVGKQKNSGNIIGIATTVNSGTNDYLLGNQSAILTYPITFIIHSLASINWTRGLTLRNKDRWYYIIISVSTILAFALVYLGFYLFGNFDDIFFVNIVGLTFALSLGATVANIFKYKETWFSWTLYNIVQLIKNILQLNFANVAKYIFYLGNSILTLIDWRFNGDIK